MRLLRMLLLVLLAGVGLAVSVQRSAQAAPKGYVMSEWSLNMREMGIVPVFPPREDLQVGDLYVYHYNPESNETEKRMRKGDREIGMSPRWGSIEGIIEAAAKEYQGRLSLPPLTVDPLKADPMKTDDAKSDKKQSDDGKNITTLPNTGDNPVYVADSKPNRLRQVAFPEFMSANFSQGNLSAIIPVEIVSLAFGAGWSRSKSVTFKIPSAESYAVPQQVALRMLLEVSSNNNGHKTYRLREKYRELFDTLPTGADEEEVKALKKRKPKFLGDPPQYWWVRVPTEVYYARAMDISVESKSSSGGRIGASLLNPAAFAQALKTTTDQAAKQPEKKPDQNGSGTGNSGAGGSSNPNPMNGNSGGSGNNQTPMNGGQQGQPNGSNTGQGQTAAKDQSAALLALLDPAAAAYARAQALNTFLQSSGSASVPGGFVQFVNASDSAISMRRTWERPIAIGFRCATFRISRDDFQVTLLNGIGTSPTFR